MADEAALPRGPRRPEQAWTDRVALAAVAGAHGVGGEVRLKLFAESVDSLKRHQAPVRRRAGADPGLGRAPAAAARSPASPRSPTAAPPRRCAAQLLTVPRTRCRRSGGRILSCRPDRPALRKPPTASRSARVVAVENFGAGDLLEIERPDGKRALIPFRAGSRRPATATGSSPTPLSWPSAAAAAASPDRCGSSSPRLRLRPWRG